MIPQSYQKVALLRDPFFSNDAMMHLLWHLCWESHFLEGPGSSAIKFIYFFFLCASCGLDTRELRVGIGSTTEAQIKWVLWLAWRCWALEKQVFIGSQRCAHSCGALRLAEGWTPLLRGGSYWCQACLWARGGRGERGRVVCRGGERTQRRADHLDHGPSKAGLTESIWTTVNRRQPVCWLPLSCIFTGSSPTNTCCPVKLFKRSFNLGFSTK